jgi:dUTP pyrophosphatase
MSKSNSKITTSDNFDAGTAPVDNPSGIPRAEPEKKAAKPRVAPIIDKDRDGIADAINLKMALVHPDAIVPTYATDGSGYFDLYAPSGGHLNAGQTLTIDTGIKVEVPKGWTLHVLSRSGHGFNYDVRLANSVGAIDQDFRGSIKVKLKSDGAQHIQINAGDRIAQAALIPTPRVNMLVVEESELSDTARGEGGLGSTGR